MTKPSRNRKKHNKKRKRTTSHKSNDDQEDQEDLSKHDDDTKDLEDHRLQEHDQSYVGMCFYAVIKLAGFILKLPYKIMCCIWNCIKRAIINICQWVLNLLDDSTTTRFNQKYNRLDDIELGQREPDDRKLIELKIRLKQQEDAIGILTKDKDNALSRLQEHQKDIQIREDTISRLSEESKLKIKEKEDVITRLSEEIKLKINVLNKEKEDVITRLKQNEDMINTLKKEKDDALSRLSELMGAKLRDNNPAITNLNDPNRPMKLGDQFSELYENEWTDSYTDLLDSKELNLTEEEAIIILLNMLQEVNRVCLQDVAEQLSGQRKVVNGFSDDEIEYFMKAVKDSLKSQAGIYVPLLCKKVANDMTSCTTVTKYKQYSKEYIDNCVKICYFAAVQDPPMYLDFLSTPVFDKQVYKEYTKSGSTVDYLVWPALFLHKGGPVLCKGVVQPK